MSQSRSQSPMNEEIFKFSPLKNKLKQPIPHQRLCRVKFLKSPKTASPSVSKFKASAFPTIYHRSKQSCKLQTRSPPSKRLIKSPVPQTRSAFKNNYMKSHSILVQKEINLKKSPKKTKNDTFISHLLQLSHFKTSRIELELDKQSKIDN